MGRSAGNPPLSDLNLFKKAVERSGEVIFLTDREGVITYVNPEFSRLYGYQPEEVVGKTTPRILKSGMMTQEEYQRFWNSLLNRQVVRGEFTNRCKDGSLVTVDGSASPIMDEKNNIIGFLAIQRDVSVRKQVKEELETAYAFQQSIIDGLADPLMVIGTDYKVKMVNRATREYATEGVPIAELVFCYQVSHQREMPCDGGSHPCPLHEVKEMGHPVSVIHQHYQKNGACRYVEISAAPLWGAENSFLGIIETMRDITEHKQAQEDLLQYTQRLKAVSARLAEVEDMERQRLARELHDQVGQNLTALGINLNIIQMELPVEMPDLVRYHLDDSLLLVEQTTEQIRDVMADLRPPVLDDYGLVAALHWYGEKISRRIGIPITVAGDEPRPRLESNRENALIRIIQEALTNVAKHALASRVMISVESNPASLRLTLEDDGIGFDPDSIAKPEIGGGWGLISMTERAAAVGGQCRIISSPHLGTRVIVELPR